MYLLLLVWQGAYFAWKATAMGKNYVNGKTFLEKRYWIMNKSYYNCKCSDVDYKMGWAWCTPHRLLVDNLLFSFSRYNNDLELEDAIHTAILTLKVKFLLFSRRRKKYPGHWTLFFTVALFLPFIIITLFGVCVTGEFRGSDDRGEHWGGDLQRGRLQKTHPGRGERLPGCHCVNMPCLVLGLAGHISRQRHSSIVANSPVTHFCKLWLIFWKHD